MTSPPPNRGKDATPPNSTLKGKTPAGPPPSFAHSTAAALHSLLPSSKGGAGGSIGSSSNAGASSHFLDAAVHTAPEPWSSQSDNHFLTGRHRHAHDHRTGETMNESDLFGPGSREPLRWMGGGEDTDQFRTHAEWSALAAYSNREREVAEFRHPEETANDGDKVLAFLSTPSYTATVHDDPPPQRISEAFSADESLRGLPAPLRATVRDGIEAVEYLRQVRYAADIAGQNSHAGEFQVDGYNSLITDFEDAVHDLFDEPTPADSETAVRVKSAVERLRMLQRHLRPE
ncbi:hypothetical protein DFJ77DRAFT_466609 [Powellomyces hirtus]|nr:hypothetical protein DFJ77DRAFT_466609 [Powellomyces hirtus]